MTLPEVCPLDENQICKGRECHLFCLEWRTREPTCLIGYSTTSKIKSGKNDRKKDTYAEETFRKLGRQPLPKKRTVSEKGDWLPTRLTEKPKEKPVERKEDKFIQNPYLETAVVRNPAPSPEKNHDVRLKERQAASEAEKASLRLESRLKKEPAEEKPIICAKTQPKVQERPKVPEKIVSRNKHTTIFAPSDTDEKKHPYSSGREEQTKKDPYSSGREEQTKKDPYSSGREEQTKKAPEDKEKRRKLDEVLKIDTPEVYDEEFWS